MKYIFISLISLSTYLGFNFSEKKTLTPMPPVACESVTGVEKIVCLADAFKATLSSSQINTLEYDYTLDNAATWSNLPVTFVPRLGLRFGDLTSAQVTAAKALIEASLGTANPEGYEEMVQLWAADEYLGQNGGGTTYDEGQYFIAFLGTPSTTGTWELQTGGHHVAVSNTYSNGELAGATPSFRAVEPFAAFSVNGSDTYQPMVQERDALAAMFAALSTSELATAKLTSSFGDILLGPGEDWQFPTVKSGIKVGNLTQAQKDLVLAAIETYVSDIEDEKAAEIMAIYTAQLDDTYIAYAGNAALTNQNQYARIDGPRVWIEFSMQGGIVLNGPHPHSIWRDRSTDYGTLGNPNATSAVNAFKGRFEVSPNPTASFAQASIEMPAPGLVSLKLFDANGRQVAAELKINATTGSHTLPLEIGKLPAGAYTCALEVRSPGAAPAIATRKLVKL